MRIGMIGLGKMGANMVRRLLWGGHSCVVFDRNSENIRALEKEGAIASNSLSDLVSKLRPGRAVVWVMVPAGKLTSDVLDELASILNPDDIVIDGGNSFYKDDIKHAEHLKKSGIYFVDVGTSGGVWGKERGYCLMVGAEPGVFEYCEPFFKTLAPGVGDTPRTEGRSGALSSSEQGYLHCGPVGSGHFVKMIHNRIEYGLIQAYAEGFEILRRVDQEAIPESRRYQLNLTEIAELWRRGSVVGSWLLDLTAKALHESPTLDAFSGVVQDSGEGRWTVDAATEEAVPAIVLTASLYARFRSRVKSGFSDKLLSALRFQFRGHVEKKE